MKKIILSALLLSAGFVGRAQFVQNFDDSLELPAGWSVINSGSESAWTISNSIVGGALSPSNAAKIVYDDIAHNDYLISPKFVVVAGSSDQVIFQIRSRSSSFLEPFDVRIGTASEVSEASLTTVIRPTSDAPAAWTPIKINLSDYVGQEVYIAIHATGTNEFELYVDDFEVRAIPECNLVEGVTLESVSSSNAVIAWPGTSNTGWEYVLAPASATSPDGLQILNTASSPLTLNDLAAATSYKIWIRQNCAGMQWSAPLTFTTSCIAFTVPTVLETFDSTTGAALVNCWNTSLLEGTTNWVGYTVNGSGETPIASSGTRIMRKAWNNSRALLISPAYSYQNITQQTRVSVRLYRGAAGADTDQYKLYVNTQPSIENAAELGVVHLKNTLAPVENAAGFYTYTFDISTDFHGSQEVYVMVEGKTASGATSNSLGLDDFKIEYSPACPDVTGVLTVGTTANTANVTWNANGAESYEVAVIAGTTMEVANAVVYSQIANNSLEIPNLTPSTVYTYMVRSVCGSNFGVWTSVATFETQCAAFPETSLPWTETFEGLTTVSATSFPSCWKKENGDWRSANAATTTNDINGYEGSDKFIQNQFSATNEFLWTLGFDLKAGKTYKLSFYYGSYDEYTDWDVAIFVNQAQLSTGAVQVGENILTAGDPAPSEYTLGARDFSPSEDGVYYFGIRVNANYNPWYLNFDNFKLEEVEPLSVGDFATQKVSYYPNPVTDRLNLNSELAIETVSIYNLMGQEVATIKGGAQNISVDMSSLSAGVYVVKAKTANQTNTFRVIKK